MPNASVAPFAPDRWIVCTLTAYSSLAQGWIEEAPADGLFRVRFDLGLVRFAPLNALESTLGELAGQPTGTVYVVVDRIDGSNAGQLLDTGRRWADRLTLRLCDWSTDGVRLVDGLDAPDQALLRLLTERAQSSAAPAAPGGAALLAWSPEYVVALKAWERAARETYGQDFVEAYGAQPIDWPALACTAIPQASSYDWQVVEALKRGVAETLALVKWVRFAPPLLGAPATTQVEPKVLAVLPSFYLLEVLPVLGDPNTTYLLFRCDEDKVAMMQGRSVTVRIGRTTHELGLIDERGEAELRIEGPLEHEKEIHVLLGELPGDPR